MFKKIIQKSFSRRQFVNLTAGSAAGIGFSQMVPSVFAATGHATLPNTNDRILVVVQLSGGNDGLNTVVPYADDMYYKNRFSLAVEKPAARKINDKIGFHPSLNGFSTLLESNQLAVVQGVGYPNPNRSHFESMDLWHTAHRNEERIPQGWLGRFLENGELAKSLDVPAIHFGSEKQPLALAAEKSAFPSIRSIEQFRLKLGGQKELRELIESNVAEKRKQDDELLSFVQATANSAFKAGARVEEVLKKKTTAETYPATQLGRKLQTVSKMISAEMPTAVYYVTLDGFDTHANQGEAHAGLLSQLGDAVSTFMNDMTKQGNDKRVLLLSFSEFGRRVRQNASQGTDHGTAGPVFLAGGGVQSGPHGKHPRLDDLVEGDLQFHTDYRQVYATILEKWFETDSKSILGGQYETLDLLG